MDVYHLPVEMERDEALGLALEWLLAHRGQERLVIVPVRDSVDHSPVLQRIALEARTETARTLYGSGAAMRGAVLVVWPSKKTLEALQDRRPTEVLVVPWTPEESDAWLRAHKSKSLLDESSAGPALISDPIVNEAMKSMTGFVSRNHAVLSYDERDYAIGTLRVLIQFGRKVDPDELYAWCLANGWSGELAGRLATLTREIISGKQHRVRHPMIRGAESIAFWEKKAAESDTNP